MMCSNCGKASTTGHDCSIPWTPKPVASTIADVVRPESFEREAIRFMQSRLDVLETEMRELRALLATPMPSAALCGKYTGDNDGTCPQLTCIRRKGHDGFCDNVRGDGGATRSSSPASRVAAACACMRPETLGHAEACPLYPRTVRMPCATSEVFQNGECMRDCDALGVPCPNRCLHWMKQDARRIGCAYCAAEAAAAKAAVAKEQAARSSSPAVGDEIVEWLHGMEHILAKTIGSLANPVEAAQLRDRRDIYLAIADDIRRKWPVLFKEKETS